MNMKTEYEIKSACELYTSAFSWHKPNNEKSLECQIFKLTFQLICVHFEGVSSDKHIDVLVKELDSFIRQLKANFDCMRVNLDSFDYPRYIVILEAMGPPPVLMEYHLSITELLKLLWYRVKNSNSQKSIMKQFRELIMSEVHDYSPTKKITPQFNDIVQTKAPKDFKAYIDQQIDITIES
jgi:hypothetical protein